jgi:hypothetical protein
MKFIRAFLRPPRAILRPRLAILPLTLAFLFFFQGCDPFDDQEEEITGPAFVDDWVPSPPDLRGSYQMDMMVVSSSFGGQISLSFTIGNAYNAETARNVEVIAGAYRDDVNVGEVRQNLNDIDPGQTLSGSVTVRIAARPTSDYCRIWWDDLWGYSYYVDLDRWGMTYPVTAGGKSAVRSAPRRGALFSGRD